jgi:hypothetical protein
MSENKKFINGSVVKPSGVIQSSSDSITLIQRKCFNILLLNAYRDLPTKETYEIKIADLRNALGYHNISELKENLKKLASTVVELNFLGTRDDTVWAIASLLADALIEGDHLQYSYGPLLREKLRNPSIYARINMAIQKNFKIKYALALYELACDHFIRADGRGKTPFIDLNNLRKLLGCSDDHAYKDYKYLNKDVIKRAIKEINEKSDLVIETKTKKNRQKVVAIQLLIFPNANKSKMINQLYTPRKTKIPLSTGGELYERLTNEYGLTDKQAKEIMARYDQDYINEKLIYVIKQAGQIDNLGAYTYKALTDNYAASVTPQVKTDSPVHDSTIGGVLLLDGTRIESDGVIYTIEDGHVRTEAGVLPRGMITKGIASGKYKVIDIEPETQPKARGEGNQVNHPSHHCPARPKRYEYGTRKKKIPSHGATTT